MALAVAEIRDDMLHNAVQVGREIPSTKPAAASHFSPSAAGTGFNAQWGRCTLAATTVAEVLVVQLRRV